MLQTAQAAVWALCDTSCQSAGVLCLADASRPNRNRDCGYNRDSPAQLAEIRAAHVHIGDERVEGRCRI